MNLLDLAIIAAAVGACGAGLRLGLVARFTSWLGMLVGISIAGRAVGPVTGWIDGASGPRVVLTAVGLLVAGAFLGQALGLVIGGRLHLALPAGMPRDLDRAAGAAMGLLGVGALVWMLTPAMSQVRGDLARLTRTSAIVGFLADTLPPAPDTWRDLEALVGADLPAVLSDLEPAPDLGTPPADGGLAEAARTRVAASTVRVQAEACGRTQEGSGAVLADELVVTNAHVVAGSEEVVVVRHPDGARVRATLVAFDPGEDLAVLSVPGIDRPPLPLADAEVGDEGAVFGHPGGGRLELSPYAIGRLQRVTGRDIFGDERINREVMFLAADLQPGDSGGALAADDGTVVGVAFAIAPDRPQVAFALPVSAVREILDGPLAPQAAGRCLR